MKNAPLSLDLDPSVFPFVLEWYRHGSPVHVPYGKVTAEAVAKAFDFLNIEGAEIKYSQVTLEAMEKQVRPDHIVAGIHLGYLFPGEKPP